MMSANVGVVKGIASGFGVDCEGMRRLLGLPLLDQGVDQAVLRNMTFCHCFLAFVDVGGGEMG